MFRTLKRSLALSAAAALASAASATAATTATTTTTTSTTTTTTTTVVPKPIPKPAKGSVPLFLPDAFFVSHQPVSTPGRTVHVDGLVRPYVSGQWVTVRAYLGHRLIKTD